MTAKPIVSVVVVLLLVGGFGVLIVSDMHKVGTFSALSSMKGTTVKDAQNSTSKALSTAPPLHSSIMSNPKTQTSTTSKKSQTSGAPDQPLPSANDPTTQTSLKFVKKQQPKAITVTAALANVRQAPGTKMPILAELKKGSTVEIKSEQKMNGKTWYEVNVTSNKKGWISSEITQLTQTPTALIDAPEVSQLPQLERGCEVTSLDMLLEQAGVSVNKMTLAKKIKTLPFEKKGLYSNPNDGFVGSIYTYKQPGLGVYHGPIASLAKVYLGEKVDDLTESNWSAVEKKLNEGHAVWVIINNTFKKLPENDSNWYTWKTKEGNIRITYREHSVLVTGYSDSTVYVNDPLSGVKNQALNKKDFIAAWVQMGKQAVSY